MIILDVSEPDAPFIISETHIQDTWSSWTILDEKAYMAGKYATKIWDISNVSSPYQVGQYTHLSNVTGLAIRGNYAYLADQDTGLTIFNITNPNFPQKVTTLESFKGITSLQQEGNYLYAHDKTLGLAILNVSNPPMPDFTSTHDGIQADILDVATRHDGSIYAYGVLSDTHLAIIDVSQPQTPVQASWMDLFAGGISVASAGDYVYILSHPFLCRTTIWVFDVSEPANIFTVGQLVLPNNGTNLTIAGNYVYVTGEKCDDNAPLHTGFLSIIDITQPNALTEMGIFEWPDAGYQVYVVAPYAYVFDSEGVRIVEISDPGLPAQVGIFNLPSLMKRGFIQGHFLYLVAGELGLHIVNIEDVAQPVEVGVYDIPGSFADVWVEGNLAYLAVKDQGVWVVDVTNPANIQEIGGFVPNDNSTIAERLIVHGQRAYVLYTDENSLDENWSVIRMLDVSDVTHIIEISVEYSYGSYQDLTLENERLYAVGLGFSIYESAYYLSELQYYKPGSIRSITVLDDYIYILQDEGLRIVNAIEPTNPIETAFYPLYLSMPNYYLENFNGMVESVAE